MTTRVFTIYELDYGIKMMRYSFATAVGIFRSVVNRFWCLLS